MLNIFVKNDDFHSWSCNFYKLEQPVTLQEVEYALQKLCRSKATGNDYLVNEMFIESANIISLHMTDLFNAIFSSGFFQGQWTEGIVILLHIENNLCDMNNCRDITLAIINVIFSFV